MPIALARYSGTGTAVLTMPAETAVPLAAKANGEALDATGAIVDNIEVPPVDRLGGPVAQGNFTGLPQILA